MVDNYGIYGGYRISNSLDEWEMTEYELAMFFFFFGGLVRQIIEPGFYFPARFSDDQRVNAD